VADDHVRVVALHEGVDVAGVGAVGEEDRVPAGEGCQVPDDGLHLVARRHQHQPAHRPQPLGGRADEPVELLVRDGTVVRGERQATAMSGQGAGQRDPGQGHPGGLELLHGPDGRRA
jgi:hypothetical protein